MFLSFFLIYSVFFTFLAIKRLDWAVMLTVFALPSYLIRFDILGLPVTLLEIMILIVFFVWAVKNCRQIFSNIKNVWQGERKTMRYPFDWEIIALLLISFVATAITGFSDDALGAWKAYFFEPILLFLVIFNTFKGFTGLRKILWSLLASVFVVSVLAVYQKITGNLIANPSWANDETRRVVSFFGYPNAVGLFLGPLVMVFIGWFAEEVRNKMAVLNYQFKTIKIVVIASAIPLAMASIFFAKSEGALIGIAAGSLVFLLLHRKLKWIAIIFIIAASAVFYLSQPVKKYVTDKATLSDFSGQVRKLQWKETWEMLKDGRMVAGSGLANYQKAVAPYHQEGFFYNRDNDPGFHKKTVFDAEYRKKYWQPLEIYLYPHNIFLNFWVELGIAGLILFIWIIGKFLDMGVILIKNRYSHHAFLIAGLVSAMIVIVIHGLVDVPYFKNDLSVMFWILVAMMSVISTEAFSNL